MDDEPSALSEMARTMAAGTPFAQATCVMAAPSISQHFASKSSTMRCFSKSSRTKRSPEATRPVCTVAPMRPAAAMTAFDSAGLVGKASVSRPGVWPAA